MAISKPLLYSAAGVAVVALFLLKDDAPATGTGSKLKRFGTKKTAEKINVFDQRDIDVNEPGKGFSIVNQPHRNAFKPLVVRDDAAASEVRDPISYVLGEPGWVYTGMAEIDGVPTALLENTRTQDGVFLKQGEKWKGVTVYQIQPERLSLMSKKGVLTHVGVDIQESTPTVDPQGGFQPVNPPLRGQIGGLAIEPSNDGTRVAERTGSRNALNRANAGSAQGTGVGDEN